MRAPRTPKDGYRRTPLVRTDDEFIRKTPAWFQEWIRYVSERLGDANSRSNSLMNEISSEFDTNILVQGQDARDQGVEFVSANQDPQIADLLQRISALEAEVFALRQCQLKQPDEFIPLGQVDYGSLPLTD